MRTPLYPSEKTALKWLQTQNIPPENIAHAFPDFYDTKTGKFYEVKVLAPTCPTPTINFMLAQFLDFQKINPTLIIFAKADDPKPRNIILFNTLREMDDPPVRITLLSNYQTDNAEIQKIQPQKYIWPLQKRGRKNQR